MPIYISAPRAGYTCTVPLFPSLTERGPASGYGSLWKSTQVRYSQPQCKESPYHIPKGRALPRKIFRLKKPTLILIRVQPGLRSIYEMMLKTRSRWPKKHMCRGNWIPGTSCTISEMTQLLLSRVVRHIRNRCEMHDPSCTCKGWRIGEVSRMARKVVSNSAEKQENPSKKVLHRSSVKSYCLTYGIGRV